MKHSNTLMNNNSISLITSDLISGGKKISHEDTTSAAKFSTQDSITNV